MTDIDVLTIISAKKIELSNIKYTNDFLEWFWLVGFRSFEIDEKAKTINCFVERPNKLIGRWNKKYKNFLIYLKKYFKNLGYEFELFKCSRVYYKEILQLSREFNLAQ